MKNQAILAIDLGSAYTKIGLRRGWNSPGKLLRDFPEAARDVTFCVSSIVACVHSHGREEWIMGLSAATQLPGESVRVFRNWKAELFGHSPASVIPVGDSTTSRAENPEKIAVKFFIELRKQLRAMSIWQDVMDCPVRICVPRLQDVDVDQVDDLVKRVMQEAGWKCSDKRVSIYEPEANAMGILSRGRNYTWKPPPRDFRPLVDRAVDMPKMLEPALITVFRAVLDESARDSYGMLVTDIGAFTTDFGYVRFDASYRTPDDWNRPEIIQRSYRLGVDELDHAVMAQLSPSARDLMATTKPADWDTLKATLYRGDPIAFRDPKGAMVKVGYGQEGQAIAKAIDEFARRVWAARTQFCAENNLGAIDAETITGGGAMIMGIRNLLISRVRANRQSAVYDMLADTLPGDQGADEHNREARRRENRELMRGATAIGACSVFFE